MRFEFSEKEQQIADDCREFALAHLSPVDAEVDAQEQIPAALRRDLAARGYLSRIIPTVHGGLGGTVTELCLQQEALAYGSITVASSVMATNLCLTPIVLFGSEEVQARYLPALRDGEWAGAIGITEPDAGSDAAAMATTARRDGADWVLDGAKRLIDNTDIAQVFLTWARTDPSAAKPHEGISAFVVERDYAGFQVDQVYHLLGLRGLGVGAYSLHGCRVPAGNLIGAEGQGWYYLMRMLEIGRTATAALCVGLAQAAFDEAKQHARERHAFGQPLARLQAIQFKIADMAARLDSARMFVYRAARLIDQGRRSDRESSMAKFWAAEAAFFVTNEALQIFGGMGCTTELPAERHFRDARIFLIGEGTSEVQRLVVARRELGALASGAGPAEHAGRGEHAGRAETAGLR